MIILFSIFIILFKKIGGTLVIETIIIHNIEVFKLYFVSDDSIFDGWASTDVTDVTGLFWPASQFVPLIYFIIFVLFFCVSHAIYISVLSLSFWYCSGYSRWIFPALALSRARVVYGASIVRSGVWFFSSFRRRGIRLSTDFMDEIFSPLAASWHCNVIVGYMVGMGNCSQ